MSIKSNHAVNWHTPDIQYRPARQQTQNVWDVLAVNEHDILNPLCLALDSSIIQRDTKEIGMAINKKLSAN